MSWKIITHNPQWRRSQSKVGGSAVWLLVICPEAAVNSLQKARSRFPGAKGSLEASQEDMALFNWELNISGIASSLQRKVTWPCKHVNASLVVCPCPLIKPRFSPLHYRFLLCVTGTQTAKPVSGFPASFPTPWSPQRLLLPLSQVLRGPHSLATESQRLARY